LKKHLLLLTSNAFLFLFFFSCKENTTSKNINYEKDLAVIIDSLAIQPRDLSVKISKSEYLLSIIAKGKILKQYPVVFGNDPIGDKRMEGDRKTPEGTFKIRDLYPHKKWAKFIWIDYPTKASWKKHRLAKQNKEIPQSATIGGEIGIHGVPLGRDDLITNQQNWTWGCISLRNKDINELYQYAFKGMQVKIIK